MNRSGYAYGSMSHSKYHGLINQGSTCYLNSVLQVLFMTKEFREAVERYHCESEPLDFYLKDLFNELKSDAAFTTKLTGVLGISRDFLQSDAAEWFENILNKMSNHEAKQLFQGIRATKTKCISCTIETETKDPFWSLPLEMEDIYDNYDVLTGFENYFKESKLSGENQLYCEKCSTKSDTTVKVEINHHPEVLTLLLKRFKYDYYFTKHVKVNRRVKIPEFLQIPPYGKMSPTYQLYAYVEHSGELRNGHYVVRIKDQHGDWYMFNDHRVSKIYWQPFSHESYEMSWDAYLLFYRKISADNSSKSTSGCSRSDQPCRIDIETKEGQKGEEDRFVTKSDKPTKDRELVGLDTNNSNAEMGNKQVQSDRRSTKVIDNQHNNQHQDLDRKQYATSKLSKNLSTGLHSEDSVVSDTTKADSQPERQEQDKAAAQAECSGVKEKGEINIEEKINKMDKQAKDCERISCDIRSEKKQLTKYDLVNPPVGGQSNPSKLHSDRKELKRIVDAGNRAQVNRSNEQAQSSGREGDGRSLENLVDNKEQPGPHDQQRAKIEVVLNKPTEVQKYSQKRKTSLSPEIDQHVEIRGESYKICEIMINVKNEKYILLKKICQASREDYSIQDICINRDCEIHKLRFEHTHFSKEPCTTPPELKRKFTKMHTVGPSESYKGGSERSQETRPENQRGQIITAIQCPSNQNQMANSIQSGTANKPFENKDAGSEHNYLTSQSSRDTTHSLGVGGGVGGDLQQPLDPQCPGSSEGLISRFQGLAVTDSSEPNKSGDQRVSTKSETFTGNHQLIDSESRRNANSQSDTQLQVKTDETENGRKDVCSHLFGSFYN